MSFLPYAAPNSASWFGALGLSTVAHGSVASVLIFSSAVTFLPAPQGPELRENEYEISLEILDFEAADAAPIDDRIPEDAETITPEDLGAEDAIETLVAQTPEEEALFPQEPDTVVPDPIEEPPVEDTAEAPPPEDVVTEDTAEVFEAEEPDAPPTDDITDAPAEELALAPEPSAPPVAAEPPAEDELAIDDLNPIEDDTSNPLAEGGVAVVPEATDDIALVVPGEDDALVFEAEPEAPDAVIIGETVDEAPVVVAEPDTSLDAIEPQPPEDVVTAPDASDDPALTEDAADAEGGVAQILQNPTAQDVALGALIRQIRATPAQQCTLALPRRGAEGQAVLALIGADADVLTEVSARISAPLDPAPLPAQALIDTRQCAALDALRQSDSYPASRLGLRITSTALSSGDSLRGEVLGAGGLFLTLLIVDDNGVVQDLAPFTALNGQIPVFDAPVARSGPARPTRQMIIALGSASGPIDVSGTIGRTAQEVFASLPPEVLSELVFGLATFDVR